MKKKYTLHFAISLVLLAFLSACNSQYPKLNWQPAVVAPLVKGSLSAEQQFSIANQQFFVSAKLPTPPVVVVPPYGAFNNVSTPWNTVGYANSPATRIGIDSLIVSGTIVNNTVIKINAGAKILIRNPNAPTNLLEILLANDLLPNTSTNFSKLKVGGELLPTFEISVANISSNGNSTPVAFGPTSGLDITFKMNLLKISYFDIAPNQKAAFDITNDFSIDKDAKTSVVSGKLDVFVKNAIPLNMLMQAYLLDENNATLDSLFSAPLAIAAGNPTAQTNAQSTITVQRVITNLDKTRYLRFKSAYSTVGATTDTRITPRTNRLDFKVIGDLNVLVKL